MRDGIPVGRGVDTGEAYDLVVVGAGISGLSAAQFFRARTSPAARILLLDNHDDFGGHAWLLRVSISWTCGCSMTVRC